MAVICGMVGVRDMITNSGSERCDLDIVCIRDVICDVVDLRD